MPSREFEQIVAMIRQRVAESPPDLPIAEQRERLELVATLFPPPDGTRFEPADSEGVVAEWATAPGASSELIILYLHGGGYCLGSIASHRGLAGHLSEATGARILMVEYRLAPENPHPAAVEDALAAYRWIVGKIEPSRLTVGGDSAGGGLTLATLVAARDAGLPLPACAFVISPWVDLEGNGESMTTRSEDDPILSAEILKVFAERYLAGQDARLPLAAPLHADLTGLPPLLIQVGDSEVLLDDSQRLAERARRAGVEVRLEVWPEMIHVWHFFAAAGPEAKKGLAEIADFLNYHFQE